MAPNHARYHYATRSDFHFSTVTATNSLLSCITVSWITIYDPFNQWCGRLDSNQQCLPRGTRFTVWGCTRHSINYRIFVVTISKHNISSETSNPFLILCFEMVPLAGFEPALLSEADFESAESTSSSIGATKQPLNF